MVVTLYQADRICSFEEVKGARRVRVKVPAGSELLRTRGLGVELFVPSPGERLVRFGWSARLVLDESRRNAGRFKVVQACSRMTALCQSE